MKYNKPEITILGDACRLVRTCGTSPKVSDTADAQTCGPTNTSGAYDLDD